MQVAAPTMNNESLIVWPEYREPINYETDEFSWSKLLKARLNSKFKISDFRLCQRGVCNANMAGRNIVCVMPTGGGKSLTYQLPALCSSGCTVVISPLTSLIQDQVLNLKKQGIEALAVLGSTTDRERVAINQRMDAMITGRATVAEEIKLLYFTPERLRPNVDIEFTTRLRSLYAANKLRRIVIDEAQCVSSYGVFRKDYANLGPTLRSLFPDVPILALSATCPPRILGDLLECLELGPIVPGEEDVTAPEDEATVYFTAPLHRDNLKYRVVMKPEGGEKVLKMIVEFILRKHDGKAGIVYCCSQNDARHVAEKISSLSEGRIRAAEYHAGLNDEKRREVHEQWRRGELHVVCATTAFGMGIDKDDVRFVIHHSTPFSVESYYQESGRAGRDGKDADCILLFRPQDASKCATTVHTGDPVSGLDRLNELLTLVQDAKQCRKVLFARHLIYSWQYTQAGWDLHSPSIFSPCGTCDNCSRSPSSVAKRNWTKEAWKIVRVVEAMAARNIVLPMAKLADGIVGRSRRGQLEVDLNVVCGGPVDLSVSEASHLIVHLVAQTYLAYVIQQRRTGSREFSSAYIKPGPRASALTRFATYPFPAPGPASPGAVGSFSSDEERAKVELYVSVLRSKSEMFLDTRAEEARSPRKKTSKGMSNSKAKGKAPITSSSMPTTPSKKRALDSRAKGKGKERNNPGAGAPRSSKRARVAATANSDVPESDEEEETPARPARKKKAGERRVRTPVEESTDNESDAMDVEGDVNDEKADTEDYSDEDEGTDEEPYTPPKRPSTSTRVKFRLPPHRLPSPSPLFTELADSDGLTNGDGDHRQQSPEALGQPDEDSEDELGSSPIRPDDFSVRSKPGVSSTVWSTPGASGSRIHGAKDTGKMRTLDRRRQFKMIPYVLLERRSDFLIDSEQPPSAVRHRASGSRIHGAKDTGKMRKVDRRRRFKMIPYVLLERRSDFLRAKSSR